MHRRDLSGTVEPGRGLGAERMTSSLLERLQALAGCAIVPGTLNLRLPDAPERGAHWRYVAAAEIAPEWEALTGQAGYHLAPVTIAGRYRGLAFQADEPAGGYPADLVELFSEVHLRTALDLADDDHLVVTLRDPWGPVLVVRAARRAEPTAVASSVWTKVLAVGSAGRRPPEQKTQLTERRR